MRKVKRKYNRKKLLMIFSIMFAGVLSLTIVYAALSTTLNIAGSAEVNAAGWGLKIEKVSLNDIFIGDISSFCNQAGITCFDNYVTTGSAKLEKEPVVKDTSIKDFKLSAQIPGDMIMIAYTVTNVGTVPAKYTDIVSSTPTITSLIDSEDDLQWINNNVVFEPFFEYSGGTDFLINEVICPGEKINLFIAFGIDETVSTIPSGGIEISNVNVDFIFTQADDTECPV